MNIRLVVAICISVVAVLFSGVQVNAAQPGENIALGKKYTMNFPPNYKLCKDDGDATQLTDGKFASGYFWTDKKTVGWHAHKKVIITIDLGKDMPISGVAVNTAASKSGGVLFPQAINISVSTDGKAFFNVGELIKLNGEKLIDGKYKKVHLQADDLKTHGRYFRLTVTPGANIFKFVFLDEIEVFAGEPDFTKIAYKESDLVKDDASQK